MRDYITQNAVEIASGGAKMTYGGAGLAVFFGLTAIQIQSLGVIVGILVGIGGLVITAIAKYYERKDRLQAMLKSGEWDGIERRTQK